MQNELELSTTSILSLFETTKAERATFVQDIIDRLVNEEADPLKIHLQVKAMEDIINGLTCKDEKKNKNYQSAITYHKYLLDAAEKYGKKFMLHNAEFSIKEVGSSYDFSKCEDPIITDLLAQQETIKRLVEVRKDFLKALPLPGIEIINEETGEACHCYPPSKSSTTSVAVSLK
jgi:hypothetical protein